MFYLLKWYGKTNRYNSWEPESHLNCDELLAEFEINRAHKIIDVVQGNGEVKYIVQIRNESQLEVVSSDEAKVWWSPMIFDFLLKKIEYIVAPRNVPFVQPSIDRLILNAPDGEVPEITCKKSELIHCRYFPIFL